MGDEILKTEWKEQEVNMRSRMTGKTGVVVMALGFILSVLGLSEIKGDRLKELADGYAYEVFRKRIGFLLSSFRIWDHWRSCSVEKFEKGDMKPYEIGYHYDPGSWYSFLSTGLPDLVGDLPLRADACVSDKIEKSIIGKGECAKCIREYLEFLTAPRFACVFFPLEMFRRVYSKSTDIYGQCECKWSLRGELSCDIARKKLKKDSEHFDVFGKYIFYLVKYEEKLSGCIFEMLYCFDADGTMVGWCPSKLMAVWASQVDRRRSVEEKFGQLACLPIPIASPFSMWEFE